MRTIRQAIAGLYLGTFLVLPPCPAGPGDLESYPTDPPSQVCPTSYHVCTDCTVHACVPDSCGATHPCPEPDAGPRCTPSPNDAACPAGWCWDPQTEACEP